MKKKNLFKIILLLVLSFALSVTVLLAACGEKFDVTFVSNGGTEIETMQSEPGKAIAEPPAPTREGYTFVGWYTDEECSKRYVFTNGVTADLTLYAKWTANKLYTVTFNSNGGSAVAAQEVEPGKTASEPTAPAKDGKVFAGWQLSDGTLFTFTTPIDGDITLYAKWANESFTVTFDSDGGSEVEEQKIEAGKTVEKPEDPVLEGHIFDGWFIGEEEYDFTAKVTEDITLKAKWVVDDGKGGGDDNKGDGNQGGGDDNKGDGNQGGDDNKGDDNQGGGDDNKGDQQFPEDKDPVVLPANVSAAGGYNESLFAEWKAANVVGVKASYQLKGTSGWTAVDERLIRMENGVARVDAVGLKAGTYSLKISNEGSDDIVVNDIVVSAYDRSGYAHFNYKTGVGAYNDDGTLKDNALVIYVTESNKNNVKDFVYKNTANGLVKEDISQYIKSGKPQSGGKDLGGDSYWSIGYILNNRGYENNTERETYGIQKLSFTYGGVAVRIIGKVTSDLNSDGCSPTLTGLTYYAKTGQTNPITGETYKKGVTVPNGGTVNDNGQMARITNAKNLTIEGIGENACMDGWGIHFVSNDNLGKHEGAGTSFEVRNITFQNYPEDAIGMEGTQGTKVDPNTGSITAGDASADAKLVSGVERCWIHNNVFLPGHCANPAESDKAEGDGSCDFKRGQYYTLSYNYFEYCHKTNLIGSSDASVTFNVTMHHNWWNNCGSRQPLARRANIHYYNNYISADPADSKAELSYVSSLRANCLLFSEANYYDGCKNVTQKKDGVGVAWNNIYYACSDENLLTELSSRTETVSNSCKYLGENIDYSQFYVDSSKFYYDSVKKVSDCLLDTAPVARVRVMMFAGTNGFGKSREETAMNVNTPSAAVSVETGGTNIDLTKVGKGTSTVSNVVFSGITGVSGGTVKGKGQIITFTLASEAQLTVTTITSGDAAPELIGADGRLYASKFTGTLTIVLQEGTYIIATGVKKSEATISALSFADTQASSAVRVEAAEKAIGDLPEQISLSDGAAVRAAVTAYEALTSKEKSSFDAALKAKLDAAVTAYETAQVEDVIAKIDAIGEVTKQSYAAINAAETAYSQLSSSQQSKVTNRGVLEAALKAYSGFAVQNVIDMIESLDAVGDNLTDRSEYETLTEAYAKAKAAYEALDDGDEDTESQKAQVTNYGKLSSGLTKLATAQRLFNFKDILEEVEVATITVEQGSRLKSAYEALSSLQKSALTSAEQTKYEAAVGSYTELLKKTVSSTFIGGKPSSDIFKSTGAKQNAKNTQFVVKAYGESALSSGLKFENTTELTFETAVKMTLTLYLLDTNALKVDGTEGKVESIGGDNVMTVTLEAGIHKINRGGSAGALYYAVLSPAA